MPFNARSGYLERADYSWSEDSVRLINTSSLLSRKKFFYVQEAGYFKTKAPYFTERANLESFLIFYTLSGFGILKYGGCDLRLKKDSTILINCMEHHYYECPKNGSWEFLWVHFNGPAALGYYNEYSRTGVAPVELTAPHPIEEDMREIIELTKQKNAHYELLSSNRITNILTELIIAGSRDPAGEESVPPYIEAVLKTIENRFTEELSLEYLASEAGISMYHLSREFKRYVGVPYSEYIMLKRINRAKELLRYTDASVEDIAYQCGFHYTSHFTSMFKKYEGNTPLKFRHSWNL